MKSFGFNSFLLQSSGGRAFDIISPSPNGFGGPSISRGANSSVKTYAKRSVKLQK